jgi:hypothetical protein
LKGESVMDYLYIPTTTLNFNNILSTGSISPAAVYAARQFGYKQFETVGPNPFRNILLLYDRYPEFVLEDAVRENYPMVIRIRNDRLRKNLLKESGRESNVTVFAYDQTIYLETTSADFFFPSERIKNIALAKSEPSLATKLVELFRPYMSVPSSGGMGKFTWSADVLEGINDSDDAKIYPCCEADDRINRLKGFASGYILGTYKSISPQHAHFRSQLCTMQNEASAIFSNPIRKYSDSKRKDVEFACSTLDSLFAESDVGTQRFDPDRGDSIRIENNEIVDFPERDEAGIHSAPSLVQFVNAYCLNSQFYDHIDDQRLEIAMDGAKAIRNLIGSQWEGSAQQEYINALLNNIKSGSRFNFNGSPNLVLQSFAAFVLKGDDLQKLEAFLTIHGIGDLRIAFALWGAMFGFSKFPKTLYNLPIRQDETAYAKRMHVYIYSVVHRVPLDELRRPATVQDESPSTTMATASGGETFVALLDQLKQEIPLSTPWHGKIAQLLQDSGGLSEEFIAQLKKTEIKDLGGKISRVHKNDVVEFFVNAFTSQDPASKSQSTLPLELPQTEKFWEDSEAWDVISEFVPMEIHNCFKKNLTWFQSEWQNPNSDYYGWSNEKAKAKKSKTPLSQRTNSDAIEAFCRLLEGKKELKDLHGETLNNIRRLLVEKYN